MRVDVLSDHWRERGDKSIRKTSLHPASMWKAEKSSEKVLFVSSFVFGKAPMDNGHIASIPRCHLSPCERKKERVNARRRFEVEKKEK